MENVLVCAHLGSMERTVRNMRCVRLLPMVWSVRTMEELEELWLNRIVGVHVSSDMQERTAK